MAGWLVPSSVAVWLKLAAPLSDDDTQLLAQCCASAETTAQTYRPEWWDADRTAYTPDAETLTAATALAARLWRRRNSPGGIETFSDSIMYVARFDPEIERGLRMAGWLRPNKVFG